MRRLALSLSLSALICGCGAPVPVMRPWIAFDYAAAPNAGPPAYASGTTSASGAVAEAVLHDLHLWLDQVPEFTVVFPDGHRAPSRRLTSATLQQHGPSIGMAWNYADPAYLGWRSPSGTRVTFQSRDGRAIVLSVCTSGSDAPRDGRVFALEAADGTPIALPLRHVDMVRWLGEPARVQRDLTLMRWPC
jgi:hypothetical protein